MADSVEEVVYDYLTTDSTFMAFFSGVYWIQATALDFWLASL